LIDWYDNYEDGYIYTDGDLNNKEWLCYSMLCYVILFYSMLFYSLLCYFILCYVMLRNEKVNCLK